MNLVTKATDHACRWIVEASPAKSFHLFSGAESEKRASPDLFAGGKGKLVTAGALLSDEILRAVFRTGASEWKIGSVLGERASPPMGKRQRTAAVQDLAAVRTVVGETEIPSACFHGPVRAR